MLGDTERMIEQFEQQLERADYPSKQELAEAAKVITTPPSTSPQAELDLHPSASFDESTPHPEDKYTKRRCTNLASTRHPAERVLPEHVDSG